MTDTALFWARWHAFVRGWTAADPDQRAQLIDRVLRAGLDAALAGVGATWATTQPTPWWTRPIASRASTSSWRPAGSSTTRVRLAQPRAPLELLRPPRGTAPLRPLRLARPAQPLAELRPLVVLADLPRPRSRAGQPGRPLPGRGPAPRSRDGAARPPGAGRPGAPPAPRVLAESASSPASTATASSTTRPWPMSAS